MVSCLFQITEATYRTHHKFYHDWTNCVFVVAQFEKLANLILVACSVCSVDNFCVLSKFLYCYKVKNTLVFSDSLKILRTNLNHFSVIFCSIRSILSGCFTIERTRWIWVIQETAYTKQH